MPFAFDSRASNQTAIFSFRKFARLGFETWVKEVVSYTSAGFKEVSNAEILAALQQLITKVDRLEAEVKDYHNIRSVTINVFPGLDTMLTDIAETKVLPPAKDLRTTTEWLAEVKGVSLKNSKKHKFANLVSDTYRTMTKAEPRKVSRPNGWGKYISRVNAFLPEEFPILEAAFNKLMSNS